MATYRCWAEVRSKIYLGPIEAKSEAEAIEKADYLPSSCWPPLSSSEEFEVIEITAEEA